MRVRPTLLGKFLLVLAPVFVACVVAGLWILSEYRLRDLLAHVTSRVGVQAAQVVGLLGDPDVRAQPNLASQVLQTLMTDRAVRCVELKSEGEIVLSAPRSIGCLGQPAGENLNLTVDGDGGPDAELIIRFSLEEIDNARREAREFGILIVVASLACAILAATFGFRRIVSAPLNQLLGAIRQSAETGEFCEVAKTTNDDLGRVIEAFNRMQRHAAQERSTLSATLARIEEIHDSTPAPLFVLDDMGCILSASSQFLEVTEFSRPALIGLPFDRLLGTASRERFASKVLPELVRTGTVRDVPMQVRSQTGEKYHLLMSAVREKTNDGGPARYLCVMADVTLLRDTEQRLKDMAVTDSLTGLMNRNGLAEEMNRRFSAQVKPGGMVSILMIDLDNFKWVNDTYGHAAGDALLMEIAYRLNQIARGDECVARLGGDEFAIFCPNARDADRSMEIARSIIESCARPIDLEGRQGIVHASVGICIADPAVDSSQEIMRRADLAMYQAKQDGRNRFCLFAGNDVVATRSKAEQMADIHRGLEENWFKLAYQPLIDMTSGKVLGAEVLLRLYPPGRAAPPIQEIINLAEETGQIDEIGQWVLSEASRQFRELQAASGDPDFYIAINVSVRQLNEAFVRQLKLTLQGNPELARHLVVEITETAMVQRFDIALRHVREIRAEGVRIAIDDFGTGYSSLSYIGRLPIDIIKLDRSFSSNLDSEELPPEDRRKRQALIRATAMLARDLGMRLVAEGIETTSDAEILLSLGVEIGQGYLFSRPLPRKEFTEWVAMFSRESRAVTRRPPLLKAV